MPPDTGADPGTAGFELNRLRQKLLNLTTSNRLLHYPVTKSTGRVIRIVDELPDQVHETLVLNGKEMILTPAPDLESTGEDGDRAITETVTGADLNQENRTLFTPDEGEGELSDTTATEVVSADLNPDLPEPPEVGDAEERHRDRFLQTDLPPEKLESRLRKMTTDANSSVEEMGVNILHLAFGFLEWYDTKDSKPRLAPLILVPVHLQRDKVITETECYAYKVIYEGEDIQQNISLAEMLKLNFAIALPELDPDAGPEQYFRQVKEAISLHPSWRVLRRIVLGFFQFSKLRMYLDLDPSKWPAEAAISNHAILKDLLEGRDSPDPMPFGDEKEYNPNANHDQIPLVVDADGSQHRALAAAFTGKNLVIEGPPGTGKSQTITNLIAGAIARGKTVLFVAEKLAALEVVRRNLDRAGLGSFCLELHSRKANKRTLLDDLHRRLKSRFVPPQDWHVHSMNHRDAQEKLENLNASLTESQPYLEEPVWKLLWRTNRLKDKFRGQPSVDLKGTETWTTADITRRMEYFEDLAQHHKQTETGVTQPWAYIYATRLMPTDIPKSVDVLNRLVALLDGIDHQCQSFTAEQGGHFANSLRSLAEFSGWVKGLAPPSFASEYGQLIPRFTDSHLLTRVLDLERAIDAHKKSTTVVNDCLRGDLTTLSLSTLNETLDSALNSLGATIKWKDLVRLESMAGIVLAELRKVNARLEELRISDLRAPESLSDALQLMRVLEFARSAPVEVLKQPTIGHLSERASDIFKEAKKSIESHLEVRSELQRVFHFPGLPDRQEIIRLLAVYRRHEHRFLRFLSGEYRQAKSVTARFSKGTPAGESLTYWLERLEQWLRQDEELTANADWREILGTLYKGIQTPWTSLEAMIAWCGKLNVACENASQSTWVLGHIGAIAKIDVRLAIDIAARIENLLKSEVSRILPEFHNASNISLSSLIEQLRAVQSLASNLILSTKGVGIADDATLPNLKRALGAFSKLADIRDRIESSASTFGELHKGESTDTAQMRRVNEWVQSILKSPLPVPTKDWLLHTDGYARLEKLKKVGAYLGGAAEEAESVLAESKRWFDFERTPSKQKREDAQDPLSSEAIGSILGRLKAAVAAHGRLPLWAEYCRERPQGISLGLAPLMRALEEGRVPTAEAGLYFVYCIYTKVTNDLMTTQGSLSRLTRPSIEGALERFCTRDRELLAKSSKRTASLASSRMVPFGNGKGPVGTWSEQALIEREIAKKRRHIPIRQLLQRAGQAITALKPCFMMSPLSVAQYLAPGERTFDLVVMDEASQLRPEDSLGAIARGKQIIVVGDPKQLPPTSFFDRLMDIDVDDQEEGVTDDTESILDLCLRAYRPACNLKWHYRSKHESLVAFSNAQFYDHELLLFPSSSRNPGEMGIRHHFVEGGKFAGRKNLAEAQAVVAAIIDHGRREPATSLGVVAFNGPQRDLIQELLEDAGKKDFSAARAIEALSKGTESLFIKNLENVQGDERDVVFISYTYGAHPDTGKVAQRFGPINGENGWRRLNVLITRAKKRVEVFTSLKFEDIHAASGHRGVQAMRGYLEYAETGRWKDPGRVSDKEPDSDFEVMVAEILERHGYKCLPQVGVDGFFIDIGVMHPDRPDEYILGVECDGATYHSNKCVRDRDRLRQEILESRGWRIHRVWSTDWWMNQDAEVQRLISTIENARRG